METRALGTVDHELFLYPILKNAKYMYRVGNKQERFASILVSSATVSFLTTTEKKHLSLFQIKLNVISY